MNVCIKQIIVTNAIVTSNYFGHMTFNVHNNTTEFELEDVIESIFNNAYTMQLVKNNIHCEWISEQSIPKTIIRIKNIIDIIKPLFIEEKLKMINDKHHKYVLQIIKTLLEAE